MALTVGDRRVHPLTADDVLRMVQAGILGEDDRVELLYGVLTEVSPKSPEHGTVIARLLRWLVAADPDHRYEIRVEHPLVVPDRRSLPEPDLAVVEDRDVRGHPTTARLVVEVAVTSQRTDIAIKPALYAGAGVPEYWVVDVVRRGVEVFTEPHEDGYARRVRHSAPDTVQPLAVPAPPLALAGLFDGLVSPARG